MFASLFKLTGLLLLPGGLLFYMLVWCPLAGRGMPAVVVHFHKLAGRTMRMGGGMYVAGILLQTWQTFEHARQTDPENTLGGFLLQAAYALPLLNLVLVPVLILWIARLAADRKDTRVLLPGIIILLMLLLDSAGSHAAADPGLLPYLGNVIHLLSAIIWAGGLFYLTLLSRLLSTSGPTPDSVQLYTLDRRFYRVVLLMFILVVSSGAVLGFVHVHSAAALYSTAYGNALGLKLFISIFATLLLAYHLLVASPALERNQVLSDTGNWRTVLLKYHRLILFEACIVSGLLITTAVMRDQTPPDTTPFLNPQTLALTVAGQPLKVTIQPVAGSLDSVRMEFFLPAGLVDGDNTRVYFLLDMPVNGLVIPESEALRVSPASYQGEATFPIPGDWQLQIRIPGAAGGEQQVSSALTIPKQPLVEDIATYLSPQAVVYSSSRLITFVTGLVLIIVYGWLALRAGQGGVPPWAVLAGTGGILFGVYLVSSVALVKTYPSTYRQNPLPLKASVVARGELAYRNSCAECHGPLGEGDGPWAITNRGAIPSLVSPHLDVHTDGEIYWWIVRGIPELDMPPREQQLDETQRWELINYLRSLRHGSEPG